MKEILNMSLEVKIHHSEDVLQFKLFFFQSSDYTAIAVIVQPNKQHVVEMCKC